MRYWIHAILTGTALLSTPPSWPTPAPLLLHLQSATTIKDLQNGRSLIHQWKKLKFLCNAKAEPSLNPHCYELANFEAQQGSHSADFPQWWQEHCSRKISALTWAGLLRTDWGRLPPPCQVAWHQRMEDLIYRFSEEDVDFLWRHRHQLILTQ